MVALAHQNPIRQNTLYRSHYFSPRLQSHMLPLRFLCTQSISYYERSMPLIELLACSISNFASAVLQTHPTIEVPKSDLIPMNVLFEGRLLDVSTTDISLSPVGSAYALQPRLHVWYITQASSSKSPCTRLELAVPLPESL